MSYSLEDTVRLNQLFDLYQELLTDKQREYFLYYFSEDYSLSEIADISKVSRNAVHLQIKNIINHLEEFESKLKLLEIKTLQNQLIDLLKEQSLSSDIAAIIKKIEKVK
ncbi:MAG: sigma factor-like helix-turn-helix DNA-binding protein [Candidatus Izemoplasmatales bacterium]|jgi:predicted DNA-binding protein YlxM (UPF0122 family)